MKQQKLLTGNEKVKAFYDLHHNGKLLILPNVWDVIGALLLEDLLYPAIATASASVAFANGYDDGEQIPFEKLLGILKSIIDRVGVPVTADIESGYAQNNTEFQNNIKRLIEAGVAGINIEDSDKDGHLFTVEQQCKKIRLIKEVAAKMNASLFINARTDVYIIAKEFSSSQIQLDETIKRGLAYKAAGADCFYPILVKEKSDIKKIVEQVQMPVNILVVKDIPKFNLLQEIGVVRVSLGPSFLKVAIKAMKDIAVKLKNMQGLNEIISNDITSAYVQQLVNKNSTK